MAVAADDSWRLAFNSANTAGNLIVVYLLQAHVQARNQTGGGSSYTFASWSDAGAQQHDVVVPSADQTYTATYTASSAPVPITFKQLNYSTPQTNQSTVNTAYTSAQTAGDTNIIAIGWNSATGTISSVTDTAGNVYSLAAPLTRGGGNLSQAIYYAKNIVAAPAGNTVKVVFSGAMGLLRQRDQWVHHTRADATELRHRR